MTRKTAVLAAVALLVAGSSAALAAGTAPAERSGTALAQDTTTGNQTTATGNETAGNASVTFLNQSAGFTFTGESPNTTTVTIERVVVPEGGFVVVHRAENVSGEYAPAGNLTVGAVVGNSTYLEPGAHSNVVVELNESIDSSQTLVAMPHRDTNDNQRYEFPEADDPYTVDGSPVVESAYVIVNYDVIEGVGGQTTAANATAETATANATTTAA